MDWKDTLERAGWTFVQTFVGVLTAATLLDFDMTVLAAGAAAAVADALVVVKQFAKYRLEVDV
jgi:hypothetical protein